MTEDKKKEKPVKRKKNYLVLNTDPVTDFKIKDLISWINRGGFTIVSAYALGPTHYVIVKK